MNFQSAEDKIKIPGVIARLTDRLVVKQELAAHSLTRWSS